MPATNQQVQNFVDTRIRPHSELARELTLVFDDDRAVIDDVYENLNNNPTWTDGRTDGPPHLLTPGDVLAINAFMEDIRLAMANHDSWPIILKACVRGV
jgi:hypothetical protein